MALIIHHDGRYLDSFDYTAFSYALLYIFVCLYGLSYFSYDLAYFSKAPSATFYKQCGKNSFPSGFQGPMLIDKQSPPLQLQLPPSIKSGKFSGSIYFRISSL